jgi:hypothetical protein
VPQRPLEQAFLREAVAEALLQCGESGIHTTSYFDLELPWYLISRYTGGMISTSLS